MHFNNSYYLASIITVKFKEIHKKLLIWRERTLSHETAITTQKTNYEKFIERNLISPGKQPDFDLK